MLSAELKNLIKQAGGRYIIVENGRPEYVVTSWKDYKKSFSDPKSLELLTEEELIDKINSDISLWRESRQETDEALIDEIENLEDIEYV